MFKKILKYGFIAIVLLIVLSALMGGENKNSSSTTTTTSSPSTTTQSTAAKDDSATKSSEAPKSIEYTTVDVATMFKELENNAAAAQKKYKGKYLKVTGKLGTIDNDMDYISIVSEDSFLTDIHCTINKKDKSQEDFVMNLSKGQTVTAYGKITDVGEVLGYWMDVDKFE